MRGYLAYIKTTYQPVMGAAAKYLLTRYYQMQRQNDEETGHTGAIGSGRATVRLLESLVRLSEAHARLMCRSHEVELQVNRIDYISYPAIVPSSLSLIPLVSLVACPLSRAYPLFFISDPGLTIISQLFSHPFLPSLLSRVSCPTTGRCCGHLLHAFNPSKTFPIRQQFHPTFRFSF